VRIVPRVCKRGPDGCWVDWRSVSDYTQRFAVQARSVVARPCPGGFDAALKGGVKMIDMDEHKSTASTKRTLRMVSDVLAMKLMRCYGVLDGDIDDFLSHCKTDDSMDVDAAASDGLRTPVVPRAVTTQKRRRKKTPTPTSKTLEASPYRPAPRRPRRRSPPKADRAAVVSAGVDTDPRLPQTTRRRGEAPTSPAPRLRLDEPLEAAGMEFGRLLKASTAVGRHMLSSELKTRPDLAEFYVRTASTLAKPSTVATFVEIGAKRLLRLDPDRMLSRPTPNLGDRQRRRRRAAVRAAALKIGSWYRAVWGLGEPAPRTARVPVAAPTVVLARASQRGCERPLHRRPARGRGQLAQARRRARRAPEDVPSTHRVRLLGRRQGRGPRARLRSLSQKSAPRLGRPVLHRRRRGAPRSPRVLPPTKAQRWLSQGCEAPRSLWRVVRVWI